MLRTFIIDAYRESEKQEIANALNDLCCPTDSYGWASAGVYCYWDYYTKEVYYIGLAVDLTERFKQHNDFYSSTNIKGCKKSQINNYFKKKEKLGFSIIVQFPLSQPINNKVNTKYKDFFNQYPPEIHYVGNDGLDGIKRQEGTLLEAYKLKHGHLPIWNKANGAIKGQQAAKAVHYESIQVLTNQKEHYLLSRSTLRELSQNPNFQEFESFLHGVRLLAPLMGYEAAINFVNKVENTKIYDYMVTTNYLNKEINI